MTGTRIGADQAAVSPGHALFHEVDGDGYRRLLRYRVNPVGEIAVTTNLDDLIRWERALDDPALGLRTLLAGLEAGAQPHISDGDKEGYTFGVYRRIYEGVPLVEYHGVGEFAYWCRCPRTSSRLPPLQCLRWPVVVRCRCRPTLRRPVSQVEAATQVPLRPRLDLWCQPWGGSTACGAATLRRRVPDDGRQGCHADRSRRRGPGRFIRGQEDRATALGNGRSKSSRDGTAAISFQRYGSRRHGLAIRNASTVNGGPGIQALAAWQPPPRSYVPSPGHTWAMTSN